MWMVGKGERAGARSWAASAGGERGWRAVTTDDVRLTSLAL